MNVDYSFPRGGGDAEERDQGAKNEINGSNWGPLDAIIASGKKESV
jgi:hypothetical protein